MRTSSFILMLTFFIYSFTTFKKSEIIETSPDVKKIFEQLTGAWQLKGERRYKHDTLSYFNNHLDSVIKSVMIIQDTSTFLEIEYSRDLTGALISNYHRRGTIYYPHKNDSLNFLLSGPYQTFSDYEGIDSPYRIISYSDSSLVITDDKVHIGNWYDDRFHTDYYYERIGFSSNLNSKKSSAIKGGWKLNFFERIDSTLSSKYFTGIDRFDANFEDSTYSAFFHYQDEHIGYTLYEEGKWCAFSLGNDTFLDLHARVSSQRDGENYDAEKYGYDESWITPLHFLNQDEIRMTTCQFARMRSNLRFVKRK
jgi:hypothetical protein